MMKDESLGSKPYYVPRLSLIVCQSRRLDPQGSCLRDWNRNARNCQHGHGEEHGAWGAAMVRE